MRDVIFKIETSTNIVVSQAFNLLTILQIKFHIISVRQK